MLHRAQIPNLLTFARMAAVPICFVIIFLRPPYADLFLFWIFVAACVTDFLDGYLARKWNAVTPIGTLLDPIADKLLVALMLLYLLRIDGDGLLAPIMAILLRELYISGLREFLASRGKKLPVSKGGKWKTALQMLAIALLLYSNCPYYAPSDGTRAVATAHRGIGVGLLYLAAFVAFFSAVSYTLASRSHLRSSRQ